MRKITLLLMLSFLLFNCSKKISRFQLKDDRSIEGIRIGMPIEAAVKLANKDYFVMKTRVIEYDNVAKNYEYVVYKNTSKKEVLFKFNGGHNKRNKNEVFRIVILNPKYRTQEGIRTNMTMKDLKMNSRLKGADFNNIDGLYIYSAKFDGGYWMDVDMKKYKSYNFSKSKIKTLPNDIKVKAIIIF